jgi:hypothetical protein
MLEGTSITYFDHSLISAHLFRCTSDCGELHAVSSCSPPCTKWVSVTHSSLHHASTFSLEGGVGVARAIVENGGAMFRHVTVRQSAGRFRLQFEWQADMMRSKTMSEEESLIVTPHHLAASGIRQTQVFAVGSRLRDVIGQENEDNCITDRFSIASLPRNDVRCAGPVQLSDVEVLALDSAGEVLEMLGSDTGFEVQVSRTHSTSYTPQVTSLYSKCSSLAELLKALSGAHVCAMAPLSSRATSVSSFVCRPATFPKRKRTGKNLSSLVCGSRLLRWAL